MFIHRDKEGIELRIGDLVRWFYLEDDGIESIVTELSRDEPEVLVYPIQHVYRNEYTALCCRVEYIRTPGIEWFLTHTNKELRKFGIKRFKHSAQYKQSETI